MHSTVTHVDNAPAVRRVYELVGPLPLPLVLVPLRPLPVHVRDQAGERDPEDEAAVRGAIR